jgi:hypothetical protein
MAKASRSSVNRIRRAFGLQPQRSETFKFSTDPLVIDKIRDIVGLYMNPPDDAVGHLRGRKGADPSVGPDATVPAPARPNGQRMGELSAGPPFVKQFREGQRRGFLPFPRPGSRRSGTVTGASRGRFRWPARSRPFVFDFTDAQFAGDLSAILRW